MMQTPIKQLINALRRAEEALLMLLLGGMVLMAVVQVVMRNLLESGIYWGDSLVRVLVLWIALVGAMVASRTDNHIQIDLASRLLSPRYKPWIARLTYVFATLVLGLFTLASYQFVSYEYQDNVIAFADVPAWLCEAILPIGGGIMTLRYALHIFEVPES